MSSVSFSAVPRAFVLGTALSLTLSLTCATQVWAKTHHVIIENMKMAPETLEVKVGDTVVWENHDIVPHTATALTRTGESKPAFDSGSIAPNASFKFKAKHAGKYLYQCLFHPDNESKSHCRKVEARYPELKRPDWRNPVGPSFILTIIF